MGAEAGFALRLAGCIALAWLGWRAGGAIGLLAGLSLSGLWLARPLVELASSLRQRLREHVWKPVEGRYFEYRGTPLQVLEDEQHRRWVRASDVRKIVGFTASDGALALSYPDGYRAIGEPPVPHFSDEALLAHLNKERSITALKFRHWVERDIALPARRLRQRAGIRPVAPKDMPRMRATSAFVQYPSTKPRARASPPQLRTSVVSASVSMS